MIERYARKEMKDIWSDENRYKAWLEVEILTVEAYAHYGDIPAEDARAIREKAGFLGQNARCQACGYLHEANISCDLDVKYPISAESNGQKISFSREELIDLLVQAQSLNN